MDFVLNTNDVILVNTIIDNGQKTHDGYFINSSCIINDFGLNPIVVGNRIMLLLKIGVLVRCKELLFITEKGISFMNRIAKEEDIELPNKPTFFATNGAANQFSIN